MNLPRPLLALLASVLLLGATAPAEGRMKSTKLPDGTCQTTGGGKIVEIPGFPGERIDRRLLRDIKWLRKRYSIYITDGYSTSDVHAANGEHPLGLALDIIPNKAEGGTWNEISALARWAEPRQNVTRDPFRWVGYDGDAGHGRGHHLHLSWNHTETKPGRTARTVYTVRCPNSQPPAPEPEPEPEPPAGGTTAGNPPDNGGNRGPSSGGIKAKLAPVVVETGGVGIGE